MMPVFVILVAMVLMGMVLWVAQAYRTLRFARNQMIEAWNDLKQGLSDRRDMVPYLVASGPLNMAPVLEVLGNACDLAANVEGVSECSQSESRLSAALTRLFTELDARAPIETMELLSPLRERFERQERHIELLRDAYNRQVDLFNALQQRGAARLWVSFGVVRPLERF